MAKLFAKAVTDENLRQQIHDGAAKRFDGDTNVLYSTLSKSSDVRAALAAEYSQQRGVQRSDALSTIDDLASDIPRFQVAVYANFDDWDPAKYTPLVTYMPSGIDDTTLKTVTAYDAKGQAHELDAQADPAQPVIVLGVNERTDDSGKVLEQYTDSEEPVTSGGPLAEARAGYLVEIVDAYLGSDHEPFTRGAAEISYVADGDGCGGVYDLDHNVTGLDDSGDSRHWSGDGKNLGYANCAVIFYWWEDDPEITYSFDLVFKGVNLGVTMQDGDDIMGGHAYSKSEFYGGSSEMYYEIDDISMRLE